MQKQQETVSINVWQPYYKKKLSDKETFEIQKNITQFFNILEEINNLEEQDE